MDGGPSAITDVIRDVFADTGYTAADIDWFVPHQANKRIIDGSAHKLGIAPKRSSPRSIATATRRPPRSRSRSTSR